MYLFYTLSGNIKFRKIFFRYEHVGEPKDREDKETMRQKWGLQGKSGGEGGVKFASTRNREVLRISRLCADKDAPKAQVRGQETLSNAGLNTWIFTQESD